MAESTSKESVGKISLDLEVQSDLQGQIQTLAQKIGVNFKNSVSNLTKGAFSGMAQKTKEQASQIAAGMKKAMGGASETVKKQMAGISETMKKSATGMSKVKFGSVTGSQDAKLQKQLEAVQKQQLAVDQLTQKYDRMLSGEAKPIALKNAEAELKRLQVEIQKTEETYAQAERRMEDMKLSANLDKGLGGKVSGQTSAAMQQLEAELDALGTKLSDSDMKAASLRNTISNLQMNPGTSAEAETLGQKLEFARSKLNSMSAEAEQAQVQMRKTGGIFSSVANKFKQGAAKIGSSFKSGIGKALQGLKNLVTNSHSANKATGSLGKSLLRVGKILKSMLLYKAINLMISGMKEGFQNLAQASGSTNQSLSMLMSALTQLKNSFAAAFAPILDVVAPILTTFINLISEAANRVGAFFAALTGKGSYTRAVSVTQDYAASLGNAASGADDAKQATQDYQKSLMGFDQINKIDSQKESGSAGAKRAGGAGGVSPGEMFETVPIDSGIGSLAEQIKDLIKAQDWFGIGALIGEKINGAIDKIDFAGMGTKVGKVIDAAIKVTYGLLETINWGKIGSGVATFLNNSLANIDFLTFGKTIGSGFMAVVDMVYGFVTTLDWSKIGRAISDSINGFFQRMDWAKTAQTISIGIRGLLTTIKQFIANTDWAQIGHDVYSFLANIDWNGIMQDLAYVVGQAIAGIGLFLWGFVDDAVTSIENYFGKKMEECGNNVGLGLLKGIWEIVSGKLIRQWWWDNVFKPMIDGIKNMLGIHSPSTVFAEIGRNLILGLLEGVKSLWNSIVAFFRSALDGIKNLFSSAWNAVRTTTSAVFESVRGIISGIWNGIKSTISSILSSIGNVFSNIWNGIRNTTSSVFNGIRNVISSIMGGVQNGISGGLNAIRNAFSNVLNSIWNIVSNVFYGIWNVIRGVVNGILGTIEGMANGIVRGLNAMIGALNRLHFSIPGWVPGLGGRSFGLSIPYVSSVYLPRLATGGIIDTPTLAMIGEDGQEAVVPLEKNTAWIDNLADKIALKTGAGGGSGITPEKLDAAVAKIVSALEELGFYIDSEKLATAVRRGENKLGRRYNTVKIT